MYTYDVSLPNGYMADDGTWVIKSCVLTRCNDDGVRLSVEIRSAAYDELMQEVRQLDQLYSTLKLLAISHEEVMDSKQRYVDKIQQVFERWFNELKGA